MPSFFKKYLLPGFIFQSIVIGGGYGTGREIVEYFLRHGPTGGYLVGFVAAAFVAGWLAERGWDRRAGTTALAMLAGNAAIYVLGLSWLFMYVGQRAAALGLLPYVAGDVLKVIVAAALLPAGWKAIGRSGE